MSKSNNKSFDSNSQTTDDKKERYFSPKYWPTHIGLFILKSIAKLSPRNRSRLGSGLGKLMYRLATKRRRVAKINLSLCFPELDEVALEALLKENMSASGKGLIETASCWYSDLGNQQQHCEVIGKENLDAALEKGKGVILLSFHMTSLEVGGCLLGQHYDFLAMYKPNKNPLFEKAMTDGRERHLKGLLNRSNLRGTIRALKNNDIVWYAADQNYGGKTTVF
ncbi:MAG: lysophospholipid acyltransferase family protein, partial [Kangiellaceae bacterium]|nr:lysophospholipid acyltransferase family protein [Kangiellaceae bacterium]